MALSDAGRYAARLDRGRPREIVTPEGTALTFVVASGGDRLGAFLVDFLLQVLMIVVLVVLTSLGVTSSRGGGGWLLALVILAIFLIQNFYFIFYEARRNGQTPGKRRLGIRVMDAGGGPLTIDAVVVRNILRNLEFYVPLAVLLSPEALWPNAPGWARFLACVWLFVFAGMPLFNRYRLRVGDLVAGTIVVVAPQAVLLPDIGARTAAKVEREDTAYSFTTEHLEVYGIYELQVLEELLRTDVSRRDREKTMAAVADRIGRKIGWASRIPRRENHRFLSEFYAALRSHLESRMLFGKRKKDKYSREE